MHVKQDRGKLSNPEAECSTSRGTHSGYCTTQSVKKYAFCTEYKCSTIRGIHSVQSVSVVQSGVYILYRV